MPIIPGDMGIKSWSYEILVVSDGTDSTELCEDCITQLGGDHSQTNTYLSGYGYEGNYELTPIFASTEMDREPTCDRCGKYSFIFSPTSYCIEDWVDSLTSYLVDNREHNTDYLDDVAENIKWCNLDEGDAKVVELYWLKRKNS